MVHIVLMILKIAGLIILVLLGLLLLAALTVVFVPLKYAAEAKCKGTLDSLSVSVKFSWLFHLVSGYVLYRERETDWQMRIAFKKLNEEGTGEEAKEESQAAAPQKEEAKKNAAGNSPEAEREVRKESPEQKKEVQKESPERKKEVRKESVDEGTSDSGRGFFEKIKYTFETICGKIKLLSEKKEKVLEFVRHEIHRNAFLKVKKELFRLLRFLRPDKIRGRVHYGLEDPYMTGKVLAVLSMLYPFYGNHVSIEPDFENKVLEGELFVKGRIRGIHGIIVFFNILVSRDIRTTYKHIRAFKL